MSRLLSITCVMLILLSLSSPAAMSQSAEATSNILFRVVMVRSHFDQGSMFSIDVDQREYWITAKHILTGALHPPYGSLTTKTVTLSILDPSSKEERWLPEKFSVIDPGNDVDIVVLAPPRPILTDPLPSLPATSEGEQLGGDCEFLGFPFGEVWQAKFNSGESYRMPFIKHCTASGLITIPLRFWVLDGINNAGFSGGPVVFLTGPAQKIMAVISGYQTEPSAVMPAKKPKGSARPALPKEIVNVNSGFIIAFDISYAVEAIKKNPIGPLRKAK